MKFVITAILILLVFGKLISQEIPVQGTSGASYQEEISRLMANAKIVQAFKIIDDLEERTRKDLIYLTEIPAPPFQEEVRAEAFKVLLEETGADKIWIDEEGNVIALREGTKGERTVVLDAHLDTVFPAETDVTVKFHGDTLVAPGIGDDTRGLVVVLTVLRALNQANVDTRDNIWIVGSVGEEGLGDLRGLKHLFREGAPKIDAWISVDGGSIARLANEGLGSYRYRVTITGPGGHSWGAFGLGNPHHALGLAIANFDREAWKFTSSGPKTSFNIGRIGGGTSINSIPFESWMEVDMRSIDPASLDSMDMIFKKTMKESVAEINGKRRRGEALNLEIERIGLRPSGKTPETHPLVQRAIACISKFGVSANLGSGSTNSNIPISLGVPAITIGRGGQGQGGHSLDEWWLNDKGADAIKMALLLLVSEAGLE